MSEKIACAVCGNMILATTAQSNGGLCMPCKRGFRKNIEDGKRRYAERKAAEANPDPATTHWRWLVGRVHQSPDGFAQLSAENQMYFAACLLEGEVYNGGFDQYFTNSSADYYGHAVRGLEEIGATECCRILVAAKQALFGGQDVPGRAERLRRMQRLSPITVEQIDAFDRRFGQEAATFHRLAAQYARKHGLFEPT